MSGQKNNDDNLDKKSLPGKGTKPHSISRRLTVGLIAVAAQICVITIAVIYLYSIREQEAALMNKAEEYRDYLVGALELPLWNYDDDTIKTICSTFFQNDLVAGIMIKEASGKVVSPLGNQRDPDAIKRTGKIYHQGELLGSIEISLTKRYAKQATRRALTIFAAIILMVLIAFVLLTHLFMRIFLKKPIEILDRIVRPYASGIYDPKNGG